MPERKSEKPDSPPTRAQETPARADGPRRADAPAAAPGRGLLADALEELNATVEELRVAEEEMRTQNEELMQTRLRVEAERHRYQDMFEFAPDGYLVTDRDGRVLEANRAAAGMLGIAPRFLKGRGLGTSVAPESMAAYAAALRDFAAPVQRLEMRLRRRHDGLFHADVSVTHVPASGNQPATLRWLVRDVSARHEAEAARRIASERERRTAETLSRLLLPALPAGFAGLSVEAFTQAAEQSEIGGGFFDGFALGEGRVALAAGLVSGGGLAAALRSAEFRYALRGLLRETRRLGPTLARLNGAACEAVRLGDRGGERPIALTLAVLDTQTGEAVLASAGGEPARRVRANGTVETFTSGTESRPLGIQPGLAYAETPAILGAGDTLLLTTGLAETSGLAEAAAAQHAAALGVMAQAVLTAARAGGGTDAQDDPLRGDVCLLLARRE